MGIIVESGVVVVGVEVGGRMRVRRRVGGGTCCGGGGGVGVGGVGGGGGLEQGTRASHVGSGTAGDQRVRSGARGQPGPIATKVCSDGVVIGTVCSSVLQPGDRWPCGHIATRERTKRRVYSRPVLYRRDCRRNKSAGSSL